MPSETLGEPLIRTDLDPDAPPPAVTVTTHQEHIIGGIRFPAGRYRIECLEPWSNNDAEF